MCNLEQGGGPVWPSEYNGNPGSGSLSRLEGVILGEERKKFRHRPQTSTSNLQKSIFAGFYILGEVHLAFFGAIFWRDTLPTNVL